MIKRLVVGLALGMLVAAMACGGGTSGSKPDLIERYAECVADPESALHELAGSPTKAEVAEGVRQEIAEGESTLEEVRMAYAMFCLEE